MRSPGGHQTRGVAGRRVAGVLAGAAGTLVLTELTRRSSALSGSAWVRRNHRGEPVNLVAGPVVTVLASGMAGLLLPRRRRRPALLLGLACGAVGLYDDIAGTRTGQVGDKGFRGHLQALSSGRVSTGAVKVVGVVGASLAAAGSVSSGSVDRVLAAGVMAGTANLVNLLDLRPGRAAKASALGAATLLRGAAGGAGAAVLGTSLGILPADLSEKVMLGDAGANALGALLGYRLAAGSSPVARSSMLAVLVALTAASERVSFTRVIEATPGLRELDAWGRPTAAPGARDGACPSPSRP
ncbi:MAG: hypothetical protein H0T99_00140 [Geodermatophilaceae bacterium]|nr:hypothetical protein [Geodermatophilaceae bacterium]